MNTLRSNLSRAQVTSYTYKPLIGMSTKTDPRGVAEHYRYDGSNHLQHVLDNLNWYIRSYEYKYRTP